MGGAGICVCPIAAAVAHAAPPANVFELGDLVFGDDRGGDGTVRSVRWSLLGKVASWE